MNKIFYFTCLVVLALFGSNRANAGLVINLNFDDFSIGAPADGDAILGGATLSQAQAVIQHAASIWETAFANSDSSINWSTNAGGILTQNIAIRWAPESNATLATAGTTWSTDAGPSYGQWESAAMNWDNDGTSRFYVDPAPLNNSEWAQSSQSNLSFNSVNMNAERVHFDAPAGTIRSNSDMLTVAVHEMGHALGLMTLFPAYAASDVGNNGTIDITSGPFVGAQVPINGSHTRFQTQTPSTEFPYDPSGGFFPLDDYYPNVMGPSSIAGVRKLLTEADIAIVAEMLQFNMATVDFNPSQTLSAVPEPSAILVWSLISIGVVVRRRQGQRA